MNNQVTLIGVVVSECIYDHEVYGEEFYKIILEIKRESGTPDRIPIIVSEQLLDVSQDYTGQYLLIDGQFRSFNLHEKNRTKLLLYIFATDITVIKYATEDLNEVFVDGYIVKPPIYRVTPYGREITDLLIAVNRPYGKSDYIPCICWGRSARFSRKFSVGEHIYIDGRFQSRNYMKNGIEKTAYELSVDRIQLA